MGLFGSNEITGIDVGVGSIKVVRIKPGKRPKLIAASLIEFPPLASNEPVSGEPVSSDIKQLVSEKKIGRTNVITQMPGKDLTIRSLTLPKIPLAELREAIRWEAKRHVSYSLDDALVEYLITGEKHEGAVDKYDVVMVAAEKSRIMEHLTPLNAAGIKVTAVDANALALRNILFRGVGVPEEEVVVVDIGAGNMEINIFKNGVLRFSRCLETGGIDMTRLVADHLRVNINEAESVKRSVHVRGLPGDDATAAVIISRIDALLMEIRRSIEYYKATFREKGVVRAILAGGTFLMSDLPEYFSESLGLPVECCDPFVALDCSDALKEEFGPQALRFATAVGLALRKA